MPAAIGVLASVAVLLSSATASATFPGRNGAIAFNRASAIDNTCCFPRIFAMRPDGHDQHQLTSDPLGIDDGSAAFAPDGRKIVFSRGTQGRHHIYVMGAAGYHRRRLTNAAADDSEPAFSPDGRRIVFARHVQGVTCLYVMRSDGTHVRQLTSHGPEALDADPSFSPDGHKIVFARNDAIYVMRSNGSDERLLTPMAGSGSALVADSPDFSPDGREIAFESNRNGALRVWVMHVSGKHQRAIGPAGGGEPAFSPDGREIAFTRTVRGNGFDNLEVWVMRADGSHPYRLARSTFGDNGAAWQPLSE